MSSIYEIISETKKAMFDNQEVLKNYIDTLIMRIDDEEDNAKGSDYDEMQGAKDVLISVKNFMENLDEIKR
jgi:hypothetical protein